MAEAPGKRVPPYIPFKAFEGFLNGLATRPIPRGIDGALPDGMSGSARSGLMMALRYFGLIDEHDIAKPALETLARASAEDRRPALKELLSAYRFVGALDLLQATPAQLTEAIGNEGATGGTREKCVAFFLKMAEAAGVAVSPDILKRKHALPGAGTARAERAVSRLSAIPDEAGARRQDRDADARSAYDVLMKEIYDPKTMKPNSEEEKAVFTLARYLATRRSAA